MTGEHHRTVGMLARLHVDAAVEAVLTGTRLRAEMVALEQTGVSDSEIAALVSWPEETIRPFIEGKQIV